MAIQDLESQNDDLKALLSQATSRADEKELAIFEMEEKLEALNSKKEEEDKGMWKWYILQVNPDLRDNFLWPKAVFRLEKNSI